MQSNPILEEALKLAEAGFHVLPLNGKRPVIIGGRNFENSSNNKEQIEHWWRNKNHNIGLSTGKLNGFWVLDVDDERSLEKLCHENGPLPETVMQKTGKGVHYFFKYGDADIRNSAGKVAAGIDVRGDGGYVVVAPSIHPDTHKEYEWVDGASIFDIECADAPAWLIELVQKKGTITNISDFVPLVDTNINSAYGEAALSDECQNVRSASNGQQEATLYKAAFNVGQLVGAGALDQSVAQSNLISAAREMPSHDPTSPWTESKIAEKVRHGISQGIANPRLVRQPTIDNFDQEVANDNHDFIGDLNAKHAAVMVNGNFAILNEEVDPVFGRNTVSFSSPADFRNRYQNQNLQIDNRKINIAKTWLSSPYRRQYEGIVFAPDGATNGFFNLWQGFSVEPKEGDCSQFLDHIFENIASSDLDINEYILDYMADAVQNPANRPGVALVLRGEQGVGKGVFVNNFGSLFGQHYLHVADTHHLLGHFNSHLKDALLVFADEAFWAGDKRSEGRLKALITEHDNLIEFKGQNAFRVRNYVRLIVASNNDWVVPAGPNERRFFVLDVSNQHRQDHDYFAEIAKEMNNGGREALLHYLLNRDLQGVNLRNFPKTPALQEQQVASLDAVGKWWLDCLTQEYIVSPNSPWTDPVTTRGVFESFQEWSGSTGIRSHLSDSQFGKKLKALVPGLDRTRSTGDPMSSSSRLYQYTFPPLKNCQASFDKYLGGQISWQKGGENNE